jgi:DNA-binding response OmpR family regulator
VARVLIVEDDLLISDCIEEAILDGGYEVCGIARTVTEAVELGIRHQPELAMIDVRLAEGMGTEISALLGSPGKFGILYATGNVDPAILAAADGIGYLSKPYRLQDIMPALRIVEQFFKTGTASLPFPRRFKLLKKPVPVES